MRFAIIGALVLSLIGSKLGLALPSADKFKESDSRQDLEFVQGPRINYYNPAYTQNVFNHVFASSYGVPYVGKLFRLPNCSPFFF
jgi:hypothetical protein